MRRHLATIGVIVLIVLAAYLCGLFPAQAQQFGGGTVTTNTGSGCTTGVSTALQKGNGANGCTAAVSGTDYQAPISSSTPVAHQFVTAFSASNTFTQAQPACADLTGAAAHCGTSGAEITTGIVPSANGGAGAVTGILKANGSGNVSAAASGTDYAPVTSGTAILKGNGAGGFNNAAAGSDYQSPIAGNTLTLHHFATSINSAGAVAGPQPACNDLSNSAASCSTDATNASNISSGTVASARGGAGTVNGILKANGSGTVSQATSGTDYQPVIAGNTLASHNFANSISAAGTLSGAPPASTDLSDLPIPQTSGGTGTNYGPMDVKTQKLNAAAGTTLNKLTCLDGSGNAFDCTAGNTNGVFGITDSGAGTTGTVTILTAASDHACVFDNTAVRGDCVSLSLTANGDCTDVGVCSAVTTTIVGAVDDAGGAAGTHTIFFKGTDIVGTAGGGGSGTIQSGTAGNSTYYTGTGTVVGPVVNEYHLGASGTNKISAAFTACPASSGCVVIGDPNQLYTQNVPVVIGNANYPQTLILNNATILCTSTNSDFCVSLGSRGRLYSTALPSTATQRGGIIKAATTAVLSAVVANTNATLAGDSLFDVENVQVQGNGQTVTEPGSISHAVIWLDSVQTGFMSHVFASQEPGGADGIRVSSQSTTSGFSLNNVNFFGVTVFGFNSVNHMGSLMNIDGSKGFAEFACIGCGFGDPANTTAPGIWIHGTPNQPRGVFIPNLDFEGSTGFTGAYIQIDSGSDIDIPGAILASGQGHLPAASCVNITGSDGVTTRMHLSGETSLASCNKSISNTISGYVNGSSALSFDYTYNNPLYTSPPVYDGAPLDTEGSLYTPAILGSTAEGKQLATPTGLICSCSPTGTAHIFYKVAAGDEFNNGATLTKGWTAASSQFDCTHANESPLTGTDTCTLTWTASGGATDYAVASSTLTGAEKLENGSAMTNGTQWISTSATEPGAGITLPTVNTTGFVKRFVSTVANLPAVCGAGETWGVTDWNGTNGACTGSGTNYVIATCGASNNWFCP